MKRRVIYIVIFLVAIATSAYACWHSRASNTQASLIAFFMFVIPLSIAAASVVMREMREARTSREWPGVVQEKRGFFAGSMAAVMIAIAILLLVWAVLLMHR